jgi:hypothetical protein
MDFRTPGEALAWGRADAEGLIVELEKDAEAVERLLAQNPERRDASELARAKRHFRSVAVQLRVMLEDCAAMRAE